MFPSSKQRLLPALSARRVNPKGSRAHAPTTAVRTGVQERAFSAILGSFFFFCPPPTVLPVTLALARPRVAPGTLLSPSSLPDHWRLQVRRPGDLQGPGVEGGRKSGGRRKQIRVRPTHPRSAGNEGMKLTPRCLPSRQEAKEGQRQGKKNLSMYLYMVKC